VRCPLCREDAGRNTLCERCRAAYQRFIATSDSIEPDLDAVVWAAKRAVRMQTPRIREQVMRKLQRDLEMKRVDMEARGLLDRGRKADVADDADASPDSCDGCGPIPSHDEGDDPYL
jgi:hypothetical protein